MLAGRIIVWVVPRVLWSQPFLTIFCAGPEKKHYYRCSAHAHVAILVNGTYGRAIFSRVEEDIFPPRAEFSFVTDSPARTCEHQRLLEVETGLISRTCLLCWLCSGYAGGGEAKPSHPSFSGPGESGESGAAGAAGRGRLQDCLRQVQRQPCKTPPSMHLSHSFTKKMLNIDFI